MYRFWMIFLAVYYHLSSGSANTCDEAINGSDYGGNLLFNVNCSSGIFSLSNQQVRVEIESVRVVSRCSGTGIVNQQPTIPVDGYDGVGKTDRTFRVVDLPLTEPGECVLTACYYVDDPDTSWTDFNLYLADHKPTCTFGLDSPTQSTISTIQSTMSASHSISEEIFATVSTIISSQILPSVAPTVDINLDSPTQSTIKETTYNYTNVQYSSSLLQSMLSSTIQSTMSASQLISEELFTTVLTIIPSSSSQILPSVAPAAGISNQTILLASTIPMAIMLVVILLVVILALFIRIHMYQKNRASME